MSTETIRQEFRRLWAQSLRQRFQNLNGRDLEAAEDVAWRAYLAASASEPDTHDAPALTTHTDGLRVDRMATPTPGR